jgi:predicted phosphodiesterase
MKVAIASDWHREFYQSFEITLDGDTDMMIVAGDVHPDSDKVAELLFDLRIPVVFVAGNHDYYGSIFEETLAKMRKRFANTNVEFLEKDSFEFGNFRFFGATLWSEYLTENQKRMLADKPDRLAEMRKINMNYALHSMNDFNLIRTSTTGYLVNPEFFLNEFYATQTALNEFLAVETNKKNIIVTHNAPTYATTNPIYQNSKLNPAFHNDMDDVIKNNKIELWVHGHTHFDADMYLHGTRIVSNQFGYPREKKFNMLYVEI